MTSSIQSMLSANNKSYKNSKKLDEVKEVIQNKPDADIIKVLEVYDNDVAKTINAFMNDGAREALSKWKLKKSKKNEAQSTEASNSSKHAAHLNNKPARKSNNTSQINHSGRNNINDLVSSIINQYTSADTGAPERATDMSSQSKQAPHQTGIHELSTNTVQQNLLNNLNNLIISNQPLNLSKSVSCGLKVKVIGIEQPNKEQSQASTPIAVSMSTSPSSLSIQSTSSSSYDARPVAASFNNNNNNNNINNNNEPNIHINFAYTNPKNSKNMLDKPQKDLQRQSALLAKIASQFQDELTKNQLMLNQMFNQIKQLINERQNQMQADLNQLANAANQILNKRQNKAAHLKFFADNLVHLNDHDTQELKADIKHFLNERQLDEEFVKLKIFQEDNLDKVYESIRSFGRISQLNVQYASKRPPTEELLNTSFSSSQAPPPPLVAFNQTNNNKPKIEKITNHNLQQKHSIQITEINGISDEDEGSKEGEFIEVKRPQRNRNKQPVVQPSNQPSISNKSNTIVNNNSSQNHTNGNSKAQKQNGVQNTSRPANKRNVNSFSLIANGKV